MDKLEEFAITATLTLSYRMIVKAKDLDSAQGIAAHVAADYVSNSSETRHVQWETPLEPDPTGAWSDDSIDFRVEETIDGDYTVMAGSLIPEDELEVSRCPACGEPIDYCQGHGEVGDPTGYQVLQDHDAGDHSHCHPAGCEEARV